MGNTKFVEALVAGGGGVAGDGVGESGVDQGRDEERHGRQWLWRRRRREKIMPTDKDPAIRHMAVWLSESDPPPPKMACDVGRRAMLPRRPKDLET
jgi:hypothetical protein